MRNCGGRIPIVRVCLSLCVCVCVCVACDRTGIVLNWTVCGGVAR